MTPENRAFINDAHQRLEILKDPKDGTLRAFDPYHAAEVIREEFDPEYNVNPLGVIGVVQVLNDLCEADKQLNNKN